MSEWPREGTAGALGAGGRDWSRLSGSRGGGGCGVLPLWDSPPFPWRPLPRPSWLSGWGSGKEGRPRESPLASAQRCSLWVDVRRGPWRGLIQWSLRHGGVSVLLPVPCTRSLGVPEQEPEGSLCQPAPSPGPLASSSRTPPALHLAVRETEAQRAEGSAGSTQHALSRAPSGAARSLSGRAG